MVNKVRLRGTIISFCEYFFSTRGDEYYKIQVEVKRKSGNVDIVPVVMPRRNIDPSADYRGLRIDLEGTVQTKHMDTHLNMYVYSTNASIYYSNEDNEEDINDVFFSGVLKDKNFRKTSLKKIDIVDVYFLSKYTKNKKKIEYYFPCIAWYNIARDINNLPLETSIIAQGRFQSKNYVKNDEEKVAYELSLMDIDVI